ncbi:Periodic tryptophan protein 1-like protein [Drosera capensis]
MEPAIEIWDLDVKRIKYKEGSHRDSVLGLAWNKEFRNILASASGDKLVKIWDAASGKCNITMEHHTDKVQAVAWNPHAPEVLLRGSFDHSVVMTKGATIFTCASTQQKLTENIPKEPLHFDEKDAEARLFLRIGSGVGVEYEKLVSLENGTVQGFDIRAASSNSGSESKPSFTLHAHDEAVCSISYSPAVPNLLATGSMDKMVKLWDLSNNQPSCVSSRNPKAGAIFLVSFSEESVCACYWRLPRKFGELLLN